MRLENGKCRPVALEEGDGVREFDVLRKKLRSSGFRGHGEAVKSTVKAIISF